MAGSVIPPAHPDAACQRDLLDRDRILQGLEPGGRPLGASGVPDQNGAVWNDAACH